MIISLPSYLERDNSRKHLGVQIMPTLNWSIQISKVYTEGQGLFDRVQLQLESMHSKMLSHADQEWPGSKSW